MAEEKCKNCTHFEPMINDSGICRRYPPREDTPLERFLEILVDDYSWGKATIRDFADQPVAEIIKAAIHATSTFPSVDEDEWCGEFHKE